MFNTSILDVAIGMVFIYLLLSLLCTATNELIELLLKKRATDLERGIRELLDPQKNSDIVEKIYNHPLVNGLYGGTYAEAKSGIGNALRYVKRTGLPSYIPARNFALALMDSVKPGTAEGAQSGAAGATAPTVDPATSANKLAAFREQLQGLDPHVQKALAPLIDAAAGDVARARANIEEWFNSSMDRVSGWYKRRSHIIVLVLGLLVAVAVNADSVLMFRKLASDRALRDSLVASANIYAQEAAKTPPAATTPNAAATPDAAKPTPTPTPTPTPASDKCADVCDKDTPQCRLEKTQCQIGALGLPLGWGSQTDDRLRWAGPTAFFTTHVPNHIFGWLLTALALSLGAPFWFDLLNKFIVVRSTVKPKEKSPEDKSKD
jgi:hypothetical protein